MSLYGPQNLGASISEFAIADDGQDEAIRSHERGSSEPTVLIAGLNWNSTNNTIIQAADGASALVSPGTHADAILTRKASSWQYLLDARYPQLNAGGTVKLEADLDCGAQKLTNLGPSTLATSAARRTDVVLKDGGNDFTADQSMGGNKLTNVGTPTAAGDAATKAYVDSGGAASTEQFVHAGILGGANYLLTEHPSGDGGTVTESFIETAKPPRELSLSIFGSVVQSDNNSRQGRVQMQLELQYIPPFSDPGGAMLHGLGSVEFFDFYGTADQNNYVTELLGKVQATTRFGGLRWQMNQYRVSNDVTLLPFRLSVEFFHNNYNGGSYTNASGLLIYIENTSTPLHKLTESDSTSGTGQLVLNVTGWD